MQTRIDNLPRLTAPLVGIMLVDLLFGFADIVHFGTCGRLFQNCFSQGIAI